MRITYCIGVSLLLQCIQFAQKMLATRNVSYLFMANRRHLRKRNHAFSNEPKAPSHVMTAVGWLANWIAVSSTKHLKPRCPSVKNYKARQVQ